MGSKENEWEYVGAAVANAASEATEKDIERIVGEGIIVESGQELNQEVVKTVKNTEREKRVEAPQVLQKLKYLPKFRL